MAAPLLALAAAILILNMLDGIFTLSWLELGAATEANPLMDHLLSSGPVFFMAGKTLLVSLGVALLWRLRHRRSAVFGLAAGAAVYSLLCIYHLSAVAAFARDFIG